jgi:hypothetical protein
MIRCNKCGIEKEESEFHSSMLKQRNYSCKVCVKERYRERSRKLGNLVRGSDEYNAAMSKARRDAYDRNHPLPLEINRSNRTTNPCRILKIHHELLKDDPERLTTDFIKKICKSKCDVADEL